MGSSFTVLKWFLTNLLPHALVGLAFIVHEERQTTITALRSAPIEHFGRQILLTVTSATFFPSG